MPVTVVDKDGNLKIAPAALSSLAWGLLTGTLSDQTDLAAALALKAPLASPALTGTPTAPTAAPATNTTQIATTAFTRAEIAALVASSPATLDTLNELALALGSDPNFAATMATALGTKEATANKNAASGYAGLDASSKLNGAQQVYGTAANTAAQGNDARFLENGPTATSTITTTGTQTALAIPAGTGDLLIRANNATLLTVQGMAAGVDGQRLTIESVGAGQVDFAHQHASATAANRLINFATVGLTSLAAGSGVAVFVYDGTTARWRLVAHEQGEWITPPYNAADFTAQAGTWTVDAGDLPTFRYRLSGRRLMVQYSIELTTISTTPYSLNFAIPGGHLSLNQSLVASVVVYDNGAAGQGGKAFTPGAGGSTVRISKTNDLTFAASTNITSVYGTAEFEVQ